MSSEDAEMWREHRRYMQERRERNRAKQTALIQSLSSKYFVKEITEFQYRFEIRGQRIDIFPTNQMYHNITTDRRGHYENLTGFLESL